MKEQFPNSNDSHEEEEEQEDWKGGGFKSEENDQKSETFHENDSSEKVGDGLDKKNEKSNANANNE